MTDVTQPIPQVPSLVTQLVRACAQKGLAAAATYLTAKGVLMDGQGMQFIDLGMSGALWVASFVWTYVQEKSHNTRVKQALAAPAQHV